VVVTGELAQSSVVGSIVTRHLRQLQACYVMAVEYDPAAAGDVAFYLNIKTDGYVSGAKPERSTLQSRVGISCLMKEAKTWKFPADYGGTTVVKFTVRFERV